MRVLSDSEASAPTKTFDGSFVKRSKYSLRDSRCENNLQLEATVKYYWLSSPFECDGGRGSKDWMRFEKSMEWVKTGKSVFENRQKYRGGDVSQMLFLTNV